MLLANTTINSSDVSQFSWSKCRVGECTTASLPFFLCVSHLERPPPLTAVVKLVSDCLAVDLEVRSFYYWPTS